jgi:hypothetical protein
VFDTHNHTLVQWLFRTRFRKCRRWWGNPDSTLDFGGSGFECDLNGRSDCLADQRSCECTGPIWDNILLRSGDPGRFDNHNEPSSDVEWTEAGYYLPLSRGFYRYEEQHGKKQ